MDGKRTKVITGLVVGLAAIGIGTGAVLAAGGGDDADDRPLRGDPRARATAAALEHVGGGEVVETEVGDDGAAYGVEILGPDGTVVEVNLDQSFRVIGSEGDDDGAGDADGPTDD